jgi:hypothetical protein
MLESARRDKGKVKGDIYAETNSGRATPSSTFKTSTGPCSRI